MYRAHSIIWREISQKHCDFIKDVGTMNAIPLLRMVLEKKNKNKADVYVFFYRLCVWQVTSQRSDWTARKSWHI